MKNKEKHLCNNMNNKGQAYYSFLSSLVLPQTRLCYANDKQVNASKSEKVGLTFSSLHDYITSIYFNCQEKRRKKK